MILGKPNGFGRYINPHPEYMNKYFLGYSNDWGKTGKGYGVLYNNQESVEPRHFGYFDEDLDFTYYDIQPDPNREMFKKFSKIKGNYPV